MTSELETNIVAVERIKEYSETKPEVCGVAVILSRCLALCVRLFKLMELGRFQGGGRGPWPPCEISGPLWPQKVQDKAATCQNFLHYILTNEFACVYVFII